MHSKRRNWLELKILNTLIFIKYNQWLEARYQRRIIKDGTSYPISLSNMKSDDKWIMEGEDAVFPLEISNVLKIRLVLN